MTRRSATLPAALAFVIAFASSTASAARFETGGHFVVAEPTGGFDRVADTGFGIQGFGLVRLDPAGWFGLRLDAGFLNYGSEEYDVPFSTTVPVTVHVSTTNNIILLGIGPYVCAPGGAVRPYAFGAIGLGYFYTQTSASERGTGEEIATDQQQSSTVLAWGAGGGLKIPVSRRWSIDLGVEYRAHQDAEYVTEGGITQDPGTGDVYVDVWKSDVNLLLFKLGVSFSIP